MALEIFQLFGVFFLINHSFTKWDNLELKCIKTHLVARLHPDREPPRCSQWGRDGKGKRGERGRGERRKEFAFAN